MPFETASLPPVNQRRYYLDWVRIFMVLLVFFVHSAMPFNDARKWCIMNAQTTFVVTGIIGFCYQWGMQLFFLVAGAGAGLSLRVRSSGHYAWERFKRLMIPYVLGVIVLSPFEDFIERRFLGEVTWPLWQHYLKFYKLFWPSWDLDFGLEPFHLWFLRYLFAHSILALPLFLWFMTDKGRRFVSRLAGVVSGPQIIFWWALPLAIVQMSLRAKFHDHGGLSDFFAWFVFFVSGYIVVAEERVEGTIRRYGLFGLGVGIACFLVEAGLFAKGYVEPWEMTPTYSPGLLAYEALRSVNTCAWVVFILSLFMRYLEIAPQWFKKVNEGVLPFYILHHPIVVLVASHVVLLQAGIPVKYALLSGIGLVMTVVLYASLVRPFDPMRFCFGMSPKKKVAREPIP